MIDKSKYATNDIVNLKKKLTLQASLKKVMTSREKPFLSVHGLVIHIKKIWIGSKANIGNLTLDKTKCSLILNDKCVHCDCNQINIYELISVCP